MTLMTEIKAAVTLAPIKHAGPQSRWRTEAMRSHATPRLIHITKGQGRITVAGLTNGYGPNNLIYIPPHTMYGMEVGPTVFAQIMALPDTSGMPAAPFHLRLLDVGPQKELLGLFEAIEQELQPTGDARAVSCHHVLLTIFIERQLRERDKSAIDPRRNSAAAKLVARYTTLIAQDFQSDRTVTDYADNLGVTPTHLTRCCQQTCSRSALKLLNERIHFEACTLLRETRQSVQDIAQNLGFQSAAYFTRTFKDRTGETPTHFRNTGLTALK
ncbi:AraC family transcriptional regulator [Loktanella sp. D2R18]|uniref:helix-turn-helix domain-containing protein n=1 Tax=Rhodobacterales TaxID=204455 RepID=UPI000DEBDBEA|nr:MULTISPECIES: AraC family transcriptional regulator [Rhodobacterales]MDO6589579.1 helix-turn-helix transcriptional regulator [Yoonia sp. 1_MG-2023]RBW44219.1 AraC family transcriptional regulator [Loktanella sp. D2R18]